MSYCCLIVFNKGSIGTNYMGLRLGIDNALHLMMCEKLWLHVCVHFCVSEVGDWVFWFLKGVTSRMWVCLFPSCSLNGWSSLNPSFMIDSWKWKRPVLICCMDTLLHFPRDSLLTTSPFKPTCSAALTHMQTPVQIYNMHINFTLMYRCRRTFMLINTQQHADVCLYTHRCRGISAGALFSRNESQRSCDCLDSIIS